MRMGSRIGIIVDGLGINDWVDANVLAAEWYAKAHDITLDITAPNRIDPEEQMVVIREVADRNPDWTTCMVKLWRKGPSPSSCRRKILTRWSDQTDSSRCSRSAILYISLNAISPPAPK